MNLVDRLASADPLRVNRRWAMPTWILSLFLHGGLLAALLLALPRLSRGLEVPPDPDAREVGIVLKSEQDSEVIFETPEEIYREQPNLEVPQPSELDEVEDPSEHEKSEPTLPRLDTSVLATAGATPTPEAANLPQVKPQSTGGAMSRTTFWNVESTGTSFVFVIDRSASMSHRGALELAKKELRQAIDQLSEQSKFQVVFYNTEAFILPLGDGQLLEATPLNKSRAKREIDRMTPEGGTNHTKPLEMAFQLTPEVVYYLTDADMLSDDDVSALTSKNRQARIPATVFAIEFGNGPSLSSNKPLRRLAADNDGTYSYLNVLNFSPSVGKP